MSISCIKSNNCFRFQHQSNGKIFIFLRSFIRHYDYQRNISKKGDVIVYDGVQTFRNGVPINNEASNAQPKFKPGWNDFKFSHFVKKQNLI